MIKDVQIAVLIPYYNAPKELYQSINSIKENVKVDLVIIDDGSSLTFNELDVKNIYSHGAIHIIRLKENSGIGVALNTGIEFAINHNYEYIGRLDCGDLCRELRFSIQIEYLEEKKDVALIGTWANVVDENGRHLYLLKHPTNYNQIKKKMFLNNTFVHPSVVFRTEVIDNVGQYPYKYRFASQDYAFFFNVIKEFKAENLPLALLDYVISDNSISTRKRKLQVKNRINIILDNFYFGFYPIYGLARNLILYFIPRSLATFIKKYVL